MRAIERRLLDPVHLRQLLSGLIERTDAADERRRKALALARQARTEAQKAVSNLLLLVEQGALSPKDPAIVERLAANRARERAAATEVDSLERQLNISRRTITLEMIDAFGVALREKLRGGSPDFRRAYVSLIIDRVTLSGSEIRISGSKAALEHAFVKDEAMPVGAVPIFDREWCRLQDSNL